MIPGMAKLVRKNLQILDLFTEAMAGLKHGHQQDTVNAALALYYSAPIDVKRGWVRTFRDIRDGHVHMSIRPNGDGALLHEESPEDAEKTRESVAKAFPGHPFETMPPPIRDWMVPRVQRRPSEAPAPGEDVESGPKRAVRKARRAAQKQGREGTPKKKKAEGQ